MDTAGGGGLRQRETHRLLVLRGGSMRGRFYILILCVLICGFHRRSLSLSVSLPFYLPVSVYQHLPFLRILHTIGSTLGELDVDILKGCLSFVREFHLPRGMKEDSRIGAMPTQGGRSVGDVRRVHWGCRLTAGVIVGG